MPPPSQDSWHTLAVPDVLTRLHTDAKRGLTRTAAAIMLERVGFNQLQMAEQIPWWAILLAQCKNTLVIILLLAVCLSAVLGHGIESAAIAAIILFAVLLGFIQEFRAGRAIEALQKMAAPTALCIRDGLEEEIAASHIVPGDIVLLASGDRIPADARVIESMSLQADESSLTGESVPVAKNADALSADNVAPGDRRNMVYAGTIVTYGRGRAVVTATGMQTECGAIAGLLGSVKSTETPLQQYLDRLGKTLGKAALGIVFAVSLLGIARGQPLLDMIIFGIALAVAVVPEALPAVVTISLAIGVQKMAKRHALVRRLPAVETLGAVSIICTDKTGTLTKDEMTVRRLFVADTLYEVTGSGYDPTGVFLHDGNDTIVPSEEVRGFLRGAVLASDTHLVHDPADGWHVKGDPTEGALVVAAAKAGLKKVEVDEACPRIAEIPFTSETKRMTTLHRCPDGVHAYAKGAPEVILASCTHVLAPGGGQPLREHDRTAILAAAHTMAEDALRVLAVAARRHATLENAEEGMTFLGLAGMIDPPRPEAKASVILCQQAGIRVIMITGDHPITARTVAQELGILRTGDILTGTDLETLDDAAFERRMDSTSVYARVSPVHKLRIVTALQKKGHIVAMTGDGVNDAPALKKADIGVAMGITGTDVTKEAAAMTLTDDNFASIVAAIEEGRGIFGNIKKYLSYLLSSNIGEICLMTGASILGMPLPLSAVQILYVNLATDGLPALALAMDPPEGDLMRRPPRRPRAGMFTRPVVTLLLAGGLWSTIVNLALFAWAMHSGRPLSEAMTMTFASLVLIQFFKAYNFRSDRTTVLRSPFNNRWLNLSVLWEFLLLGLIIELPFLQTAFGTVGLSARDWLLIIIAAVSVVPVLECVKWLARRHVFGPLSA